MTEETPAVETEETRPPEIEERSVSKSFTGSFGGEEIAYTATAATEVVPGEDGKKAIFFHVAYTKDDADPATRPIVFAFNGGPGSSTVWLHMGLLGPRRVDLDDEGRPRKVPGGYLDNPHSILDVADVVHIDAIGTGFSTADPKDQEKEYHHFTRDLEAFSDFIVTYLNRHGRWASPKYLAGESYGTTRGAAIAHHLFDVRGVTLNGLILISSVLNFQTIGQDRDKLVFRPGNDLPYMVFLPSYAATAWYHQRLSKKYQAMSLREVLDEVEDFAIGRYWSALARGNRLEPRERARIVSKLADYTGLPSDYIERYDLRIHIHRFCKELLRDRRRTVGRLDSRYLGIDRIADGDTLENDPAHDTLVGVFAAALNQYLRRDLGFESADFYEILSLDVNKAWDYEDFKGHYVDTSERLRDLLSRSRDTRVLVANGYFDLATPHFATEYTFGHMGLDPELRDHIRMEYYEAGHMMYAHRPSLERLAGDLRGFIEGVG